MQNTPKTEMPSKQSRKQQVHNVTDGLAPTGPPLQSTPVNMRLFSKSWLHWRLDTKHSATVWLHQPLRVECNGMNLTMGFRWRMKSYAEWTWQIRDPLGGEGRKRPRARSRKFAVSWPSERRKRALTAGEVVECPIPQNKKSKAGDRWVI